MGFEILKPQEDGWTLLKRHVTLLHSKSGHHKTILKTSPHLYIVVTRVSYLATLAWLQWRNEQAKNKPELKLEQIKTPNWMVLTKSYRRDQEKLIKNQI